MAMIAVRRNTMFSVVILLLSAASFACAAPPPMTQADPVRKPQPYDILEPRVYEEPGTGEVLPYRVFKPIDPDPAKKHPLYIFLHGVGQSGSDNIKQVEWMGGTATRLGKTYDAVVLAPQCPVKYHWVEVPSWSVPSHVLATQPSVPMRMLLKLIPEIDKEFNIDPERRYLYGLSMGGYGVWEALCRKPDWFAAGIPICGGADEQQAPKIAHIPVWVFHGGKDNVVRVSRSRNMVRAMMAAGGAPRYTEYPDVPHWSWQNAGLEPGVMEWLFAQRRVDPKNVPASSPVKDPLWIESCQGAAAVLSIGSQRIGMAMTKLWVQPSGAPARIVEGDKLPAAPSWQIDRDGVSICFIDGVTQQHRSGAVARVEIDLSAAPDFQDKGGTQTFVRLGPTWRTVAELPAADKPSRQGWPTARGLSALAGPRLTAMAGLELGAGGGKETLGDLTKSQPRLDVALLARSGKAGVLAVSADAGAFVGWEGDDKLVIYAMPPQSPVIGHVARIPVRLALLPGKPTEVLTRHESRLWPTTARDLP